MTHSILESERSAVPREWSVSSASFKHCRWQYILLPLPSQTWTFSKYTLSDTPMAVFNQVTEPDDPLKLTHKKPLYSF